MPPNNKPGRTAVRAADFASMTGGSAPAPAIGFGGFSGAQRIDVPTADPPPAADLPPTAKPASTTTAPPPPDLDLHLRRLAKKDPTTRAKAARSLAEAAGGGGSEATARPPADLAAVLPPLAATLLPRLVLDASRPVRLEVFRVVGAYATALGRGFAPHFKSVAGPWWLATADGAADVSRAATAGWSAAFPTPAKLGAALAFARTDILDALTAAARARPSDLGWDGVAAAGAAEGDLEERAGRARAAALRAAAALVTRLADPESATPPNVLVEVAAAVAAMLVDGAGEEMAADATPDTTTSAAAVPPPSRAAKKAAARAAAAAAGDAIIDASGRKGGKPLLSLALGPASLPAVRAAAARAVAALAAAAPAATAAAAPSLGPPIFRALGEADATAAGPIWDAALRLTALPDGGSGLAWRAVGDVRAVVLPRLAASLRSPLPSAPAARGLLPLLASAPTGVLLPDGAGSLVTLLDAAWAGVAAGGSGAPAAASALREGVRWGLGNAAALGGVGGGDASSAVEALVGLASPFGARILPAALAASSAGTAPAALAAATGVVADAVRPGAHPSAWPSVLAALEATVPPSLGAALATGGSSTADATPFTAAAALVAAVDEAAGTDGGRREDAARLAAALAAPLVPALAGGEGATTAPPAAAATLLATLIERHPAAVAGVGGGADAAPPGSQHAATDSSGLVSLAAAADALVASPPGTAAAGRADVLLAVVRAGGEAGAADWRRLVGRWAGETTTTSALTALLARLGAGADAAGPAWRGAEVDGALASLVARVVSREVAAVAPAVALLRGSGGHPLASEAALGSALAALGSAVGGCAAATSVLGEVLPGLLALPDGDVRPAAGGAAGDLMMAAAAATVSAVAAAAATRPARRAHAASPSSDSDGEGASSSSTSSSESYSDDSLVSARAPSAAPASESDDEEGGATPITPASTAAAAAWAHGALTARAALTSTGRTSLATSLLERALDGVDDADPAITAAALADVVGVEAGGGEGEHHQTAAETVDAALAVADAPLPLLAALVGELGPGVALTGCDGQVRAREAASLLVAAADGPPLLASATKAVLRSAAATPAEQAALAAALERQLAGERKAAAAAALAARLGPEGGGGGGGGGGGDDTTVPADAALAALTAATLQYAAPAIAAASWPDVMRRVRAGVAAATAGVEAAAEAASAAAVAAARTLAGPAGADATPAAALEMLRRLRAGGGPAARAAAARAAGPVAAALGGPDAPAACRAAEAWAACFAALDARFSSAGRQQSPRPTPPPSWPPTRADCLADAARAGLALGVVDAVAASAGGAAPGAAAAWASARPGLAALGAAGLAAAAADRDPDLARAAAAEADAWGEDTGVDAAGAALAAAVGGCGGPAGRAAALSFLVRDDAAHGLLAALITPVIPGEDEDVYGEAADDDDSDASSSDGGVRGGRAGGSALLEAAGVRADLASALAAPPGTPPAPLFAAWAAVLARLEGLAPGSPARAALGQALHECDGPGGVGRLLDEVAAFLPLSGARQQQKHHHHHHGRDTGVQDKTSGRRVEPKAADPAAAAAAAAAARLAGGGTAATWTLASAITALPLPSRTTGDATARAMAPLLFRAALRGAPASARTWFAGLRHRGLAAAVERYTADTESASIIAGELAGAAGVGPGTGADAVPGWAIRTAPGAREVVASLAVEDGASLELGITLPPAWPLRPATVAVRRAVGVPDARLRRWMLAIAAFLRAQNGGLAGAVRLWRANVAREFAGLEECLICYAIVAPGSEGGGGGGGLPRKACRTCGKRFHGGCLYKWFRSSAKAASCPHCQAEWGVA